MEHDIVNFIFPDFEAIDSIRYDLPQDLIVLEAVTLQGFEIYLVEQWLSERRLSTAITTYTGSSEDVITAVRLTLATAEEAAWPATLKSYIAELVESLHCKPKETEEGIIYVTSLSQFPSYLNLVEVDRGNIRDVWQMFNVNLNLKKMGCSGRSALTLSEPTKAIQDKFRQTFRLSADVEIRFAARELVLIVQTFLYYYNLLPANYCDGILCNQTEDAVQKWWDRIGTGYFGAKHAPGGDGLGAASVAAIVSFTLNMKLRLELMNTSSIDVPKDPLNVERFRLAIGQFQKYSAKYSSAQQAPVPPQLPPTLQLPGAQFFSEDYSYFLDQITIDNLMAFSSHKMSTQQFKNDFNKVKKMLRNTVSDISSGRTYLNLSSSNAALQSDPSTSNFRDLETLTDMLTLDIDKMVFFIQGRRLLYLWRGKGRQVNLEDVSLARSIKKQLAKQHRHHATRSPHTGYATQDSVDYLSIPPGSLSQSTTNKDSIDKKSYNGRSTTSGSTNGLELYDSADLYPSETNDGVFDAPYDAHRGAGTGIQTRDWLFLDNDRNFQVQLNRRSSFPFVRQEVNKSMVECHQEYIPHDYSWSRANPVTDCARTKLRRTNSFSLLESSLLTWDYPFSPSVNRLALDYLFLKSGLEFQFKDSSEAFAKYITDIENGIESEDAAADFAAAKAFKSSMMRKTTFRQLDAASIEELSRRATSKKEFLDLKLKDIELLNSRLVYEVRLLTNKVKDVEDNLRQLQEFKVKKVIENLSLYQAQRPALKERLAKYQEIRRALDGTEAGSLEDVGKDASTHLIDPSNRDTMFTVVCVYLLAMWHQFLKLFSAQGTMNDRLRPGGVELGTPKETNI